MVAFLLSCGERSRAVSSPTRWLRQGGSFAYALVGIGAFAFAAAFTLPSLNGNEKLPDVWPAGSTYVLPSMNDCTVTLNGSGSFATTIPLILSPYGTLTS